MAEEKRGKAEPLASDEWGPCGSGRSGQKKPFGLLVTYGILEWKQWYPTERARQQAMAAILRKRTFGKARYGATPIA